MRYQVKTLLSQSGWTLYGVYARQDRASAAARLLVTLGLPEHSAHAGEPVTAAQVYDTKRERLIVEWGVVR